VTAPDSGGDTPISIIRLTGGTSFVWDETPIRAIKVSGKWGYHNRWSQAWRDSADTVQNNPLTSTASTVTVADADGADSEGDSPRFQVGHLIRVESEYLRVLAVNTSTNTLTVQRAAGGTTAAAHSQNTPIQVYQPPLDVVTLALRWAVWLYKEPDSREFAPAPETLVQALEGLRRFRVKV
jgi:hypothetical protein